MIAKHLFTCPRSPEGQEVEGSGHALKSKSSSIITNTKRRRDGGGERRWTTTTVDSNTDRHKHSITARNASSI